jgi:hypothetical protein
MRTPALGWVGELLRLKPAPIPWGAAFRTGIAVVTPVAIGMAVGQQGAGYQTKARSPESWPNCAPRMRCWPARSGTAPLG